METPKAKPRPQKAATPAVGKKLPDWERIELDYRAGIKTLRQIAGEQGLSHAGVLKRARAHCWVRVKPESDKTPVRLERDELDCAGFVYVVYLDDSASQRFYKIGMAASFTSRFSAHQCSSPFAICVACAYFVGNMRSEERHLHSEYSGKRVRGEWFRLDDADLEQIARRAKLV